MHKFITHFAWGPKLDAATETEVYEAAKLARAEIVCHFERWKADQRQRTFAVAQPAPATGAAASPLAQVVSHHSPAAAPHARPGTAGQPHPGSLSARGPRPRAEAPVRASPDDSDIGRAGWGVVEAWPAAAAAVGQEHKGRAKSVPRERAEGSAPPDAAARYAVLSLCPTRVHYLCTPLRAHARLRPLTHIWLWHIRLLLVAARGERRRAKDTSRGSRTASGKRSSRSCN